MSPEPLQCLIGVLPAFCSSVYEELMLKTAFLLAFWWVFRVGELVASLRGDVDVQDIYWFKGGVVLILQFSKTDQWGVGDHFAD